MVEQLGVYWLGTMALLITYVALARSQNLQTQIIALGFALLFWTGFTMNAGGYSIITNSGVELTRSSQSLSLLGILGVGVVFVVLVKTVFDAIAKASSSS